MNAARIKKITLRVLGVLAVVVGLLWVGQGLNLIPGSFMTGDPKWFVIGAVLTLVGVLLIILASGRQRRPDPRR